MQPAQLGVGDMHTVNQPCPPCSPPLLCSKDMHSESIYPYTKTNCNWQSTCTGTSCCSYANTCKASTLTTPAGDKIRLTSGGAKYVASGSATALKEVRDFSY